MARYDKENKIMTIIGAVVAILAMVVTIGIGVYVTIEGRHSEYRKNAQKQEEYIQELESKVNYYESHWTEISEDLDLITDLNYKIEGLDIQLVSKMNELEELEVQIEEKKQELENLQ